MGCLNCCAAKKCREKIDRCDRGDKKVPYCPLGIHYGIEMRRYPSVNWACTKMTYQMKDQEESWFSSLFALFAKRKPQNKMFRKLFRYISGANDQKEKNPHDFSSLQRDEASRQQHDDKGDVFLP